MGCCQESCESRTSCHLCISPRSLPSLLIWTLWIWIPICLPSICCYQPAEAAEEPAVESERKRREAEADPAVLASYTKINNPLPVLRTAYTIPTAVHHGVYTGLPLTRAGVYAAGYGYPYVFGK